MVVLAAWWWCLSNHVAAFVPTRALWTRPRALHAAPRGDGDSADGADLADLADSAAADAPAFAMDGMLVYGHTVDESGRVKVTDAQLKTQIQNIRQRGGEGEGEGGDGGDEGGGEGATDADADAPIDAGGDSRVRQLSWQPKGGKGSVDNALETTKRPAILKDKELKPRTVAVGAPGGGEEAVSVTVWEVAEPQAMMESWMLEAPPDPLQGGRKGEQDPFGVVLWPGGYLLSSTLLSEPFKAWLPGRRVLCVGAGTGLEAMAARHAGADVLATDINDLPLALLEYAAAQPCNEGAGSLTTAKFDLLGDEPLPPCDLLIAADCIYNLPLAKVRFVARLSYHLLPLH